MAGALSYLEGLDENAGPDARSEAEQTVVENAREIEKLKEDLKAYEWAASLEQSGESTPVDIENALAKLFVGEPLDAAETAIASALAQAHPEYFPTVEKKNPLRLGPGTLVLETDEAMSAAYTTRYSRAVLGDDLALALYNADECLAATEKSAFYAQLLLIDEEAKQAGYETPRAYFEANPEAKEAYAWVNRRADEVRQARIEAEDAEVKRRQEDILNAGLHVSGKVHSGAELTQEEQNVWDTINGAEINREDRESIAYLTVRNQVYGADMSAYVRDLGTYFAENGLPGMSVMGAGTVIQAMAMQYVDSDVKLAKMAGMTLEEYYARHPERRHDPQTLLKLATEEYKANEGEYKPLDLAEYISGVPSDAFEGNEGVGVFNTIWAGAKDAGMNWYGDTALKNISMYGTKKPNPIVISNNWAKYQSEYGPVEAPAMYLKDLRKAVSELSDPKTRAYWEDQIAKAGNIFNVAFNFADQKVENKIYENNKNIAANTQYLLDNATASEFAGFRLTSTLTNTAIGGSFVLASPALTGNPLLGVELGFGLQEQGSRAEDVYQKTGDLAKAQAVGLAANGTILLLEGTQWSSLLKGHLDFGAKTLIAGSAAKKTAAQRILMGTLDFLKDMPADALENASEEWIESIALDIVNAAFGVDKFNLGSSLSDANKAFVVSFATGPILTLTGKLNAGIQQKIQAGVLKKLDQRLQTPEGKNAVTQEIAAEILVDKIGEGAVEAAALGETAAARAAAAAQEASAQAEEAKANLEVKRSQNAAHLSAVLENPTPETARAYTDSLTAMMEAGKMYTAADKAAADAQNAAREAARQVEMVKQAAVDALTQEARDMAWQEAGGSQGNSAWKPRSFLSAVGRKGFDLMNQMFLGVPAGYGTDGKGKPFAQGMDQTESMQPIRQDEAYDMASLLANSNFDEKPNWETMKSDHLTYSVEETKNGLIYYYSHGILEPGDIVPDPNGEPVEFNGWVSGSKPETFAGYGSEVSIDVIDAIVGRNGGNPERWEKQKRMGIVTRTYPGGEEETGYADFHWYYEPTVGEVERKIKANEETDKWFYPKTEMYR